MANTWTGSVWKVDTSGSFPLGYAYVVGVKIVGGSATASLTLTSDGSSGATIYTDSVASGAEKFEQVNMGRVTNLYATISGTGAVAYIYCK